MSKALRTITCTAVVAAAVLLAAPSAASATPPSIDPLSATPKFITINADTAEILSVQPWTLPASTTITHDTICPNRTVVCFWTGRIPYADQGFWGTPGTVNGRWPARRGGYTGTHTATFRWDSSETREHERTFGANTGFGFASGGGTPVLVVGRSVRIH
jgi:hypothetical protein